MKEYSMLHNYLCFSELFSDTMGTNYRTATVKDRKAVAHRLVCKVNPVICGNAAIWKRVQLLLEGIAKSKIPFMYSPEKIVLGEGSQAYLEYGYLAGRNLEQILQDSDERNLPLNFDLVFSLALSIADIVDIGSSVVISGEKSFHGFLTPDNILVQYDGKIFLKNYAVFPYMEPNEQIFSDLESRYGAWLAPEFLKKQKLTTQTDIYYLGYLVYRMLTGKFFSYTTAEDFDSKFINLTFKQYIPSTDKEFLSNVILFLKKTLNPNPDRRFQSIKEFKDFIGSHFRIEELSTVTFNLSYFMNTLYGDMVEREDRTLQEELKYVIPEPKKEPEKAAPAIREDLVSNILEDLEKEKKSRKSIWLAALLVVFVAVAVTIFFVVIQPQRAKKLEATRVAMLQKQQQDKESELMKRLDEMKNQLQQKEAVTEQDKKDREEQLRKLQTQIEDSRRYQEQQRKAQEDEQKKKLEEQQLKQKEEEARKQKESEDQKKREEEEQKKKQAEIEQIRQDQLRTKEGQEVSMALVDVKPEQISGKQVTMPNTMRNKYLRETTKSMIVFTQILVDENGKTTKVKVLGTVPDDIRRLVEDTLLTWTFKPAMKDNVRVKVWIPKTLRFQF